MYCLVKVEPLISYKSLSCFQFKPLLESTLQADQKLEEGAKKLEKEQLERKRQEELAKQRQVIIKLIALTGKDLDELRWPDAKSTPFYSLGLHILVFQDFGPLLSS